MAAAGSLPDMLDRRTQCIRAFSTVVFYFWRTAFSGGCVSSSSILVSGFHSLVFHPNLV